MKKIKPALSIEINQLVYNMRRAGEKITALSLGEAFFDIPLYPFDDLPFPDIYHYTDSRGILQLREKLAEYFQKTYEVSFDPENEIIVTGGSKIAVYMALLALINPGDEVIIPDIEYPSVMVLALHLRDTYGVRLRTVAISPTESHATILTKIESAITDRTKLIFASHIHYLNGLRMPGKEICALAHSHGAEVLFDGAQGLVHVNLDLQDMDIDYYSMPGQKWLLGPDGIGALYIKESRISKLRPRFVSSRAAKTWDALGTYEVDTDSIGKFRLTTTSAPVKAGFKEALRFVQEDLGGVPEVDHGDLALPACRAHRGAVEEGFSQAKDVLEGIAKISQGVTADIDETLVLVMKGIDDFAEGKRGVLAATDNAPPDSQVEQPQDLLAI
mgnify:CR=1 FL=1